MAEAKTAQEKYEAIVAEFPDFESEMPKLSELVADDPVMQICLAGPEVFDHWLKQVLDHEKSLKKRYDKASSTQAEIAQAGAAVWNYWQSKTNPKVCVRSLLDAAIGNFFGFHFLNRVEFLKAESYGEVDFSGAMFSDVVDFSGATFSERVDFSGATFSKKVDFAGVIFSEEANFSGVTFSDKTYFSGAAFADETSFVGVTFSKRTSFVGVIFFDLVEFQKATFCAEAYISRAAFSRMVNFAEVSFSKEADFAGGIFCRAANFAEAKFCSKADFRNVEFQSHTIFTRCVFEKEPPLFHNAKIHQDASFLEIKWLRAKDLKPDAHTSKEDQLAEWQRSYRTLKLAFAQHQSVREEQEFGRLEMEMDRHLMRHLGKWGQAVYLTLYGKLADYGYSAQRPALWLLGLFAVGCCVAFWAKDCSVSEALKLSLAYTLPPFVLATKFPDTGYWFAWFALQRLLSYLFLFLIALAWRNRAKSK